MMKPVSNFWRWTRLWRTAFLAIFLCASLLCIGCDDEAVGSGKGNVKGTGEPTEGKWVVEIYFCGSNLESDYAAVTMDLAELTDSPPPENVTFVFETGGSNAWNNDVIQPGEIGRYSYTKEEGVKKLETLPDADMGDGATLADFLKFAEENFEADHRVLILWDHGGGTLSGACQDERTGNMISLNEMQDALAETYAINPDKPPFEIIGFDACLMSAYGVARTFEGYAHYFVASQELEPGNGWNYKGIVKGFRDGIGADGAVLGKVICDSYLEGCEESGTDDEATLAVTDLTKLQKLTKAYEEMGSEAVDIASNDREKFFSRYSRQARKSTNYGGNSRDTGFTNMIDMGDFANRTEKLLPKTSKNVRAALDEAVVYRVNGFYRENASGLSCYYPLDGSEESESKYAEVKAASKPFENLYRSLTTGEPLKPGTQSFVFDLKSLEDLKVDVDEDGAIFCDLDEQQMDLVDSVRCNLMYYDLQDNILLVLGSDTNVDADWDTGHFKDNFDGTWPMLDGHPIYIEVTEAGDDYTMYAVPIKLNGREMNMIVAYDYKKEAYKILGAREGLNESGMADRNLVKLKTGDEVTTIHYVMQLEGGSDEPQQVDIDTFRLQEDFKVADEEVGDGTYMYCFEFVNPQNDYALSDIATYKIENGEITTSTDVQ